MIGLGDMEDKLVASISESSMMGEREIMVAGVNVSGHLQTLDEKVVHLWRAEWFVATFLILVLTCIATLLLEIHVWWLFINLLLAAIGCSAALILPPRQYMRWRFALRAEDLLLMHGLFWRTTSIVPYIRIQHVDTNQGPLARFLGLASVTIYTAGSVGGSLVIKGLRLHNAEELRDQLAALSGSDDGV